VLAVVVVEVRNVKKCYGMEMKVRGQVCDSQAPMRPRRDVFRKFVDWAIVGLCHILGRYVRMIQQREK